MHKEKDRKPGAGTKTIWEIIMTSRMHKRLIEHMLADTGVFQGQHKMLMEISMHPGMSQKELAEMMRVSSATVAVMSKKLDNGGYIRRVSDEKDGRFNRMEVTELGKEVVKRSIKIFNEVDSAMEEGFSEEEQQQLHSLLQRMQVNLRSYGEKNGLQDWRSTI